MVNQANIMANANVSVWGQRYAYIIALCIYGHHIRDHLREPEKVAPRDWWSLNTGGPMSKFDCMCMIIHIGQNRTYHFRMFRET